MFFKNICVILHWMKEALALEELKPVPVFLQVKNTFYFTWLENSTCLPELPLCCQLVDFPSGCYCVCKNMLYFDPFMAISPKMGLSNSVSILLPSQFRE